MKNMKKYIVLVLCLMFYDISHAESLKIPETQSKDSFNDMFSGGYWVFIDKKLQLCFNIDGSSDIPCFIVPSEYLVIPVKKSESI